MHLQAALHWCVYPRGYLVQSPAHGRACLKDTGDFAARSHCSAFLQTFSNYGEEEGKEQKAIPNPAIKLQRLAGSWFSSLEGM